MSNELNNTSKIFAKEALPMLTQDIVFAGTAGNATRTYESDFSNEMNIGDEISIAIPNDVGDIDEMDVETQVTYIKTKKIKLKVEKHFYKKLEINTKDATFNAKSFFNNLVSPVMYSFSVGVEKLMFKTALTQTYNFVELSGAPASLSDLTKILTKFNRLNAKQGQRRVILTTTANDKVMGIDAIIKANERANSTSTSTGVIGNHMGIDYFYSNILDEMTLETSTFSGGALKGALVKGQDSKIVTLDGAVEGETVKSGTIIKLGSASIVAKYDAVVDAAGEVQIEVDYVGFNVANDTAATVANVGNNLCFEAGAIALVTIAPALPSGSGIDAAVATNSDLNTSIRVTQGFNLSTLKNEIVFDLFAASKVVVPEKFFRV